MIVELTVFSVAKPTRLFLLEISKIDRLISIVVETEKNGIAEISLRNQKGRNLTARWSGLDTLKKSFVLENQCITLSQNHRVGVTENNNEIMISSAELAFSA